MTQGGAASGRATGAGPTCYRHPQRETWIRCQRCEKPICPDCMREAAVGFQCPDCVSQGAKASRQHQGAYGGQRSADPRLTTFVLMGLNVAVWLAVMATGATHSRLLQRLALRGDGACFDQGMREWYPRATEDLCQRIAGTVWVDGVSSGDWWQPVTSAFTHVEVWHVGLNMLGLYFLGPMLEGVVGRVRFLAIYLGSALTASAAMLWLANPHTYTVGASGAIFGLMGAILVLAHKVRANLQQIGMWVVLNFVITFTVGGISWQGHVGGFVGGVVLAAIVAYAPRPRRETWQWLGISLVVALAVGASALRAVQLA